MWIKLLLRFAIPGMFLLVSLAGCFGLNWPPPPAYVHANVELDKDGVPRIDYMSCINKESDLRKRHYLLRSASVKEHCIRGVNDETCANGRQAYLWSIGSEADSKTILFPPERAQEGMDIEFNEGAPLPQTLRYGENIPGTFVAVPAAQLRVNTEYAFSVSITSFNSRDDYWSFTANGYFRLEPDGKGGLRVVQRGEPCK